MANQQGIVVVDKQSKKAIVTDIARKKYQELHVIFVQLSEPLVMMTLVARYLNRWGDIWIIHIKQQSLAT